MHKPCKGNFIMGWHTEQQAVCTYIMLPCVRCCSCPADISSLLQGCTALHWAAASGREDAVTMLLSHGADVNAKDATVSHLLVRKTGQPLEVLSVLHL